MSRHGLFVGLAFGLAFVSVIWAATAGAAVALPKTPGWLIWTPAALALASVAGSALAAVAALTEPRGPRDGAAPQLPPVQHPERYAEMYAPPEWTAAAYRHGTSWHSPAPDRPSAERPTPAVEVWECPVQPGYPRTVADLRSFARRPRRRDLRQWE